MTQDKSTSFVEVRISKKHGNGLFVLKDFSSGERVYSFSKGRIVGQGGLKDLSAEEKIYLDKIGENTYEIIEPPARYTNHSCEPNIQEKERTGYALRDIKIGEELTINYDEVAYLEKPFKCRCDSRRCRGLVRGK